MITKYNKIQKQARQRLIFSIVFGFILAVIVGFLVISNLRINDKRAELNEQRDYLQKQLRELEAKRDQLQAQISETNQEDYLETEARERLNLQKPGEEVVAILPPNEQPVQQEAEKKWWNPLTW